MKLESQLVSLDLAKRLKELGVKQESLFCWSWYGSLKEHLLVYGEEHKGEISAFTVAELGEMLPKELTSKFFGKNVEFYYTQIPDNSFTKWIMFYRNSMGSMNGCEVEDENEANARAKMLIYLLENNLVKVENINGQENQTP